MTEFNHVDATVQRMGLASLGETDRSGFRTQEEIEKFGLAILLEQRNSERVFSKELCEVKLQAAENAARLQEKMSECCCETRELINRLDKERIKEELTNANLRLLVLQAMAGFNPVLSPVAASAATAK